MLSRLFSVLTLCTAILFTPAIYAAENNGTEKKPEGPEKLMIYSGNEWDVQLYGYIMMEAAYNTANVENEIGPYFVSDQYGATSEQKRGSLSSSLRHSRLGFKINGPDVAGAKQFIMTEVDFNGDKVTSNTSERQGQIRMRHAFVKLTWPTKTFLLVGQTNMLVPDKTFPTTLNEEAYTASGMSVMREPQIRIGQVLGDTMFSTTFEASVARAQGSDRSDINFAGSPGTSGDERGVGEASKLPMSRGRIGIDFNPINLLNINFGCIGSYMRERHSLSKSETKNIDAWSAQAYATISYDFLTLAGSYLRGQSLDQNFGGIGQGICASGPTMSDGKVIAWTDIDPVKSTLMWGQVRLNLSNAGIPVMLVSGYGIDNPDNEDLDKAAVGAARLKNTTIDGSMWLFLSKNYHVGVEFAKHETEWKGHGSSEDYRTSCAFKVSF